MIALNSIGTLKKKKKNIIRRLKINMQHFKNLSIQGDKESKSL